MPGIFVFIASPAEGSLVSRRLTVSGSIGNLHGRISSLSIRFPGGESFSINPPGADRFGNSAGSWSWSGLVPASVRPGQPFGITIQAYGHMQTRGWPEPEFEDVDGSASRTLWLEYVVPQVTVTDFQSPMAITDATYPFTLSGSVTGTPGDPYYMRAQYQIGASPAVPLGPGPFSVQVQLPPGDYPITVSAGDQFSQAPTFRKTLTVLKAELPANMDAVLPKTPSGIPTTASVTSWTRLEPQCSGADLDLTTGARLFDPLWLMTRQWQVGEFQGEDAGSPVQARVRATSAALSRYHPGELSATNARSLPYRADRTPLELLAERRPMGAVKPTDVAMLPSAVDAGLHFLRMLELDTKAAKYRGAFLAKYAMPPLPAKAAAAADSDTLDFVATMAGRAPDGRLLAAAFQRVAASTFKFDPALGIGTEDAAAVKLVATNWLATYHGLFSEPHGAAEDAWVPPRLEYAVSVAARLSAQSDVTLSASEFDGGRLDWSSFDVNSRVELDTTGDRAVTSIATLTVPAPVTFKGAPAPRFWEMEDAKVAFGLMSVGPTDLAHLMMIEYASSYGNDWYTVPLTLPVGSVTRVDSLVVTDTFGVRSLLKPIGDPSLDPPCFSMWQLSNLRLAGEGRAAPASNLFFLPPTLGQVLDGPPLEDVLFMRDEMANLAWGIERTIEGGVGTAVSLTTGLPPTVDATPHYVLSTMVPENWAPLMPVQVDDRGTVRLKRAATLQIDGSTKPHSARSAVLNAAANLMLYDEEIPREGVRITQRRRMARWIDGSTWVWTAFRNEVGRGEGSAGLRFDQTGDETPG